MATLLVGQQSAGTTTDFFASGDTAAFPFTAVASGTLATLWAQFGIANPSLTTVRIGIYDESGGFPNNPLAAGTVASGFTGTGLFSTDVSATALSIVSGTHYWLALYGTGEQVDLQGTTSSAGRETTGNMPSGFGAGIGGMGCLPVIWGEAAAAAATFLLPFRPIPFIGTNSRSSPI